MAIGVTSGTAPCRPRLPGSIFDKDRTVLLALQSTPVSGGHGTGLDTNGVVCAQCHPNGANAHPKTYPKFQKQLGRVAAIWEMINWCIENPLEGKALAADDPKMIAMQAYLAWERRGVALEPGKH